MQGGQAGQAGPRCRLGCRTGGGPPAADRYLGKRRRSRPRGPRASARLQPASSQAPAGSGGTRASRPWPHPAWPRRRRGGSARRAWRVVYVTDDIPRGPAEGPARDLSARGPVRPSAALMPSHSPVWVVAPRSNRNLYFYASVMPVQHQYHYTEGVANYARNNFISQFKTNLKFFYFYLFTHVQDVVQVGVSSHRIFAVWDASTFHLSGRRGGHWAVATWRPPLLSHHSITPPACPPTPRPLPLPGLRCTLLGRKPSRHVVWSIHTLVFVVGVPPAALWPWRDVVGRRAKRTPAIPH